MTLHIKYVDTLPKEDFVLAKLYEEKHKENFSKEMQEAIFRKPHAKIIEFFEKKEKKEQRYLFIKTGSSEEPMEKKEIEELGSLLLKLAKEGRETALLIDARDSEEALSLLFGILLSDKESHPFHFVKEKTLLSTLYILCKKDSKTEETGKKYEAIIQGILYARFLAEAPPNILYPVAFAEKLKELTSLGLSVEILYKDDLEKLGMHALLAVSAGSYEPPCVAILEWKGENPSEAPYLFVGKGVCFDAGGICLKSKEHQQEMKFDKAGGSAVAGLLKTVALEKFPRRVIGIIGLTENMPGGRALKPGSVIQSLSQLKIEIVDTDAEGRLLLADCLFYGEKRFQPKVIIDLATLTLDTIASLGTMYGGLYSKNKVLTEDLLKAASLSSDLLWELPMGAYFLKEIQSHYGDLKNSGKDLCGENGSAAEFLHHFVTQKTPFAHLDIGGVSWVKEESPLSPIGATGFGVRLLEAFLHSTSF